MARATLMRSGMTVASNTELMPALLSGDPVLLHQEQDGMRATRYCARTYTQAFFPDFNGASTRL